MGFKSAITIVDMMAGIHCMNKIICALVGTQTLDAH